MHHGDVNRAATWYLSHGHEAFLEKQEELEEQAALALSMGENGESKQELNALSTEKELFVVVSLEEAQSLRRAMQKHPVLRHAIALYTPDGLNLTPARKEERKEESKKDSKEESKEPLVPAPVKLLRQTTAEVVLPMTNPSPLDLACQVTKFFNSQLWYTDTEVVWVLMSLDDSAESERRVAFEGNCCYQLLSIALFFTFIVVPLFLFLFLFLFSSLSSICLSSLLSLSSSLSLSLFTFSFSLSLFLSFSLFLFLSFSLFQPRPPVVFVIDHNGKELRSPMRFTIPIPHNCCG